MKSVTKFAMAFGSAAMIAACGGGGGGGGIVSTGGGGSTSPSQITSYFVDGPVMGVGYACAPSGLSGTTSATGAFTCQSGDTATFTVNAGAAGTITLGSLAVPATSGVSLPVTMLPNGLQMAAILQALNHGTTSNMDVSGVTISPAAVSAINSYISSGGTLPSGQASDDQFLAWVQSQTSGVSFTTTVTGAGNTFRDNTVLPHLQATIIAISTTNPAPVVTANNTTKLSGTILVSGSGTFTIPNCPNGTVSFSGGGILNATVNGNIQTPGTYTANWTSPGFQETITTTTPTCTIPGSPPTTIPGNTTTQTVSVPPLSGSSPLTVASAFSGTTLTIPAAGGGPAGCTEGPVTGTDVGLSNPLITLSATSSCSISGANINATATAKLVGAW